MIKNKKILIAGGSGQLAKVFIRSLTEKGADFLAPLENELDITNYVQTRTVIDEYKPEVLINCAAYNFVEDAEENQDDAFKVNRDAVAHLAEVCKSRGILLVHFSTDYVFDGEKKDLYTEDDVPRPLNVYGLSKWEGEQAIRKILNEYLIFRLSWVFGDGKMNMLYKLSQWAQKNRVLRIVSDEVSIPTYTEDVVKVVLSAIDQNLRGLYHLTNSGSCSRYDYAKYYFEKMGDPHEIIPVKCQEFPTKVTRPLFSAMSNKNISDRLKIHIPSWQDAIERFIAKRL